MEGYILQWMDKAEVKSELVIPAGRGQYNQTIDIDFRCGKSLVLTALIFRGQGIAPAPPATPVERMERIEIRSFL